MSCMVIFYLTFLFVTLNELRNNDAVFNLFF
jgi:hypothetical protein